MTRLALLCLVVPFLGCANLQPLPQQSLNCLKAEFTPSSFASAATCLATLPAIPATEACLASVGIADTATLLSCEATAIASDKGHAQNVAAANSVPVETVQANAASYLQAKGVAVTVSAPVVTAPPNP